MSSHNSHSVSVRTERSVLEFRLLRGARHVPVDRTVFRRTDQIPGRHRSHVGVRLHFVQFTAREAAVRHRVRHHFHVVAADIHPVHGTRTVQTGNRNGYTRVRSRLLIKKKKLHFFSLQILLIPYSVQNKKRSHRYAHWALTPSPARALHRSVVDQ